MKAGNDVKNSYNERIKKLQAAMKKEQIDFYLIPMCDYHGSEYVGEHFKCICYYSGFTGSSATMLLSQKESYLWTDGRYFLQAKEQLSGSDILLMRQGEEGVLSVTDFLLQAFENLKKPEIALGFDGRLLNQRFVSDFSFLFSERMKGKSLRLCYQKDLAGSIWQADKACPRPARANEKIWILKQDYAGSSSTKKLDKLRTFLKEKKADILILTSLDEIAYVTNLRGGDIAYTPVFLSYMMISEKEAVLYMQKEALSCEIELYLKQQNITIKEYDSFFDKVKEIPQDKIVCFDPVCANYLLEKTIPDEIGRIYTQSPVLSMKAVKNDVEIENERICHIKDGVALTRFIYWLKTKVRTKEEKATELSAAKKLESLRRQGKNYLGQSFAPIIAYKEHGAIVHYCADESSDVQIGQESFLLADTGGHYLEGTTDVTRTIVMGELGMLEKKYYTAVLCGNLRLMDAQFKHGSQGANLDYLAREPLYQMGLDYNHGTGHGVGYLLSVHEGPNAFRQHPTKGATLLEGMITSDEPGYYEENHYGIRLENLILCKKKEKTSYGQFMCFEPLTLVPFDLEAVDVHCMEKRDIESLNRYHALVYQSISPFLTEQEREWLKHETRPISIG